MFEFSHGLNGSLPLQFGHENDIAAVRSNAPDRRKITRPAQESQFYGRQRTANQVSAANHLEDVSPKLNQLEYAAAFYCLGFIQGAMDADAIWQTAETQARGSKARSALGYCAPQDASWPQIVRIVVKWLEDNPEKLNLPGYDVINFAMSKAYPCSTTGP